MATEFNRHFRTNIQTHLTSALALVVALAWNSFISVFFDEHISPSRGKSYARFVYAILITLTTALIVTFIAAPKYGGGTLLVRR